MTSAEPHAPKTALVCEAHILYNHIKETRMDVELFCELLFNSTYIPVMLLKGGKPRLTFGGAEAEKLMLDAIKLFDLSCDMPQLASTETATFAYIPQDATDNALITGPAAFFPDTCDPLHAPLSASEAEKLRGTVPYVYYNRFANIVRFVCFTLNGNDRRLSLRNISDARPVRTEPHAVSGAGNTLAFEKKLLSFIRRGAPEELKSFLLEEVPRTDLAEGKVGGSSLRQSKNIFIGFISVAGKAAAIPGGAEANGIYSAMSGYINACESCRTVEEVKKLQFHALIDLAEKVRASRLPKGLSPCTRTAAEYARNTVYSRISAADMAKHSGVSPSMLYKKFAEEMQCSPGAYINDCKLDESRRLLAQTDRSIADIAASLGFSSQPHFQNMFKRKFGVTPKNYRLSCRGSSAADIFSEG